MTVGERAQPAESAAADASGGPAAAVGSHRHEHDHTHDHADEHAHSGYEAPDDHDRAHAHAHDHGHAHSHSGETQRVRILDHAPPERAELPAGAGRGKLLLFDAFSGLAGDMTIAALLDLGVPFRVVADAVDCLGLPGVELRVRAAVVGSIGATKFDVIEHTAGVERTYAAIAELIARAPLEDAARQLALAMFRRLAEAESEVHRIPIERVHFHEVGAVDAIVDIVGSAACLTYLGAEVCATPLPMARGFVHSRHGVLPLPAPATLACLKGVPTYPANLEAELVTPTGAAIIATAATRFAAWVELSPERIGWGSGMRSLEDRPNALRVVLGGPQPLGPEVHAASRYVVLETNVDDMTGELCGYVLGRMLREGALDAWAVPVTMKKGRPGQVLSVLVRAEDAARVSDRLLAESSSLGVRRYAVERQELPRELFDVATPYGPIPVKRSASAAGVQAKPEFDACVVAAEAHGVPVRVVQQAALDALGRRGDLKA